MLRKIIFKSFICVFVLQSLVQSAENGGMPQLNPEFWISQIFWLIFSFGTMFVILSKFILPKISQNLENRKSQIMDNIETAEKQRKETKNKIEQYEKIILDSKTEAKNYFNRAKQKIDEDINKKKTDLENEINKEIRSVEKEINDLNNNAHEKINKIAIETSSNMIKQFLEVDLNKSSISAIVEEISKKNRGEYNGI